MGGRQATQTGNPDSHRPGTFGKESWKRHVGRGTWGDQNSRDAKVERSFNAQLAGARLALRLELTGNASGGMPVCGRGEWCGGPRCLSGQIESAAVSATTEIRADSGTGYCCIHAIGTQQR